MRGSSPVIDPLVASGSGSRCWATGRGTTLTTAGGLIAFALLGLGASLLLARHHPDAEHARP